MQSTAIEVHELHKSYDCQLVLRGLSFTSVAGAFFGIAGPNGAGKTTTEILQGLLSRDAGDVEVLGLDPGRERKRLRPLLGSPTAGNVAADRARPRPAHRGRGVE